MKTYSASPPPVKGALFRVREVGSHDWYRLGGPIEPVPGSHLFSSAYDSSSGADARRGGEHKTDSHRVGAPQRTAAGYAYLDTPWDDGPAYCPEVQTDKSHPEGWPVRVLS